MKKFLILTILALSFAFYSLPLAFADVPHLINYQGRLTDKDDKPLQDGTYEITFRIYDAEAIGNLLWQETQSVITKNGIFNVLLGSATNLDLPFDKPYWLEIKVGSEVMSPRQRIASAGYALRAEIANSVKPASIDKTALANSVTLSLIPSGTIMMWSGSIAPEGWLLCDGSVASRSAYSNLFSVVGTIYGAGDGTTTFNLPDLRGRFPLGKDNMGGGSANRVTALEADNLGQGSGNESHNHSSQSAGSHSHGFYWAGSGAGAQNPVWAISDGGGHSHTINNANGLSPYITLNYIIKY